jgi:uncharacterized spore protein YtfJ
VNAHDVQESVSRVRDAISVTRVFGEPFEKGGVTVIPAARVAGGGGGGLQDGSGRGASAGAGFGSGFGMVGRPAGVFVITGDRVRWQPAVDPAVFVMAFSMLALVLARAARRRRRAHRIAAVDRIDGPAPVADGRNEPAPALR